MTHEKAIDEMCWVYSDDVSEIDMRTFADLVLKHTALSTPAAMEVSKPVPTQAEWEEMAYRFCCLLDHVTGGRMSKPNYELSIMKAVADDHMNEVVEDAIKEALDTPPEAAASVQRPSDDLMRSAIEQFVKHRETEPVSLSDSKYDFFASIFADVLHLATPVVQGKPVALTEREIGECMVAVSDPLQWGGLKGNGTVIKEFVRAIEAKLALATPAPSPKEPTETSDDIETNVSTIEAAVDAIEAKINEPREPGWSYRNTITVNRDIVRDECRKIRAALATRGPIGAVEPAERWDKKHLRLALISFAMLCDCYANELPEDAMALAEDAQEIMDAEFADAEASTPIDEIMGSLRSAILALSRTPGAGNAD